MGYAGTSVDDLQVGQEYTARGSLVRGNREEEGVPQEATFCHQHLPPCPGHTSRSGTSRLVVHGTLESPHLLISKIAKFMSAWLPGFQIQIVEGRQEVCPTGSPALPGPSDSVSVPESVSFAATLSKPLSTLSLVFVPLENMALLLARCPLKQICRTRGRDPAHKP